MNDPLKKCVRHTGHNEASFMCGRFVRAKASETYGDFFGVPDVAKLLASYNVAPTQPILALRMQENAKAIVAMRWGLIPSWAKDKKLLLINARGDTVADKPAFRSAFKKRRCLIIADGYYEWKPLGPKQKQPYYFRLKNDEPITFAGLWETWSGDGEPIQSCTIITTDGNELTREVHDRMPVILRGPDADAWIDPEIHDAKALMPLLCSYPASEMNAIPVSSRVNKVGENDAALIEPLADSISS
jgi:putative SOS response-associated peptidase YedK